MKVRTAIATTLINADKILLSFVNYHLQIGFDHIYLFFDDPNDQSILLVKDFPNVTVIPHDEKLRSSWQQTKLYQSKKEYHHFIDVETMTRQMLNMAVACKLAIEDKVDWIVHIDIDELFYSPHQSVCEHFTELTKHEVSSLQYVVYEAIPPRLAIDDFFKDVTVFRRNPDHYSYRQTHFRKNRELDFKCYDTGKTAALVSKVDTPLIHNVILKEEPKRIRRVLYNFKTKLRDFFSKLQGSTTVQAPIILHYPICGFNHFQKKYSTLGKFSDKAFGERNVLPFHRLSRDVFQLGDTEKATEFFINNVMLNKTQTIKLLEANILVRIEEPSRILRQQ